MLYAIIGGSWFVALLIEKYRDKPCAKWLLRGGVIANLLTLGYYKYFNFGVDSFHAMLDMFGMDAPTGIVEVLLPIGISFFVFHAISYIVDVWRQDTPATKNLFDFAAFIF